jgi:hypothetical protein
MNIIRPFLPDDIPPPKYFLQSLNPYLITCCKNSKEWIIQHLAGIQESARWILTSVATQKSIKHIIFVITACYF